MLSGITVGILLVPPSTHESQPSSRIGRIISRESIAVRIKAVRVSTERWVPKRALVGIVIEDSLCWKIEVRDCVIVGPGGGIDSMRPIG